MYKMEFYAAIKKCVRCVFIDSEKSLQYFILSSRLAYRNNM